ncbi:PIN domain-containing protein [bacterium]|nr:MAG: PIN domain-containing protein [bacterium]
MVEAFVADANLFVSAILSETSGPVAFSLLTGADAVYIPTVCQAEVAHVVLRKFRQNRLTREEAEFAFSTFLTLPNVHRQDDPIFNQTMFVTALGRNLGSNDLIYALLAQRLDLPFVTADAGLITNASGLCRCVDLRTL